ncbi:protein of unknown function [Candidatus Promineifilum breve]|uniref:Uncharacterized protein n=1 Tax=Candidatus Promineifilum breve TaxID=1806508 RepID=A0A160T6H9_9CHLR|nr:protein of unknown function [Candidatus Promineifilum breve]
MGDWCIMQGGWGGGGAGEQGSRGAGEKTLSLTLSQGEREPEHSLWERVFSDPSPFGRG